MRELTQKNYTDNVKLIHKVAKGCYARIQAAGVPMDYDDVFQELSLTFVKAWRQFDESKGFQFSTYFVTGARHQFNRTVAKPVAERVEHGTFSIEERNSCGEEGDLSLADTIASDDMGQEERLQVIQRMEHLSKTLSPLTKLVLEWLLTPPADLQAEVNAAVAHADYSREQGQLRRATLDVSIGSILSFIRMVDPKSVSKREVTRTRRELDRLLEAA